MSGDGDVGEGVDRQRIDSTEPPVRDDVEARQSGPTDPPTTTSVGELQVRIASLELQLQQLKIHHETEILKKEAHKAEIDGLKAQGKESAREIRELKKKGTWQFTLEKTPRAYWTDRDEGLLDDPEEYADSMRNLQGAIKDSVIKLREGGRDESDDDDLYIRLSFEGGGMFDHAHHDDVMIPYWQELANALVHGLRSTLVKATEWN